MMEGDFGYRASGSGRKKKRFRGLCGHSSFCLQAKSIIQVNLLLSKYKVDPSRMMTWIIAALCANVQGLL